MASARFRASKYRHATGSFPAKELWYPDIRPSGSSDVDSIASSATHVAVIWENNNSLGVLDFAGVGKRAQRDVPKIHAHSSQIYDVQFSPHADNILATCSDDCHVKIWSLPTDSPLESDISQPSCDLLSHKKRVASIRYHPSASGILASTGNDGKVFIHDIDSGASKLSLDLSGNGETLAWNYDGSLLTVCTSDNKISVWDPRTQQCVQDGVGHQGAKASRSVWLGNQNRIASTGFSKHRERQFSIWDSRDLSNALKTTNIDSSTGILQPFYDIDTSLLFIGGKGDGNVRCYEIVENVPYFYELSTFVSDLPTKSLCMAPKRAVNVMQCEVVRLLKLTSNSVAPISFSVPRKSKRDFAEDLFPDTASLEPALSGQEWINGGNAPPRTVSLRPYDEKAEEEAAAAAAAAAAAEEEAKEAEPEVELPKLNIVRSSKFRHISGKFAMKSQFYENVRADNSFSTETETIKCSRKYFAVPWSGPGGQVGVFELNKPCRLPAAPGLIECGAAQLDLDWNPFDDELLVTGLDDATTKIWKIPEGLVAKKTNHRDADGVLKGHYSKVSITKFHPLAANVLTTASYDLTVKLWDLNNLQEKVTIKGHPDVIQSLCYNYNGSIIATACKDKNLRLMDARSATITGETAGHTGAKPTRVTWLGNSPRLFSVGFAKSSDREFSIWDTRSFNKPLATHTVDNLSGVINPIYDEGTGVVFLAGKGDGTISYYELVDEEPYAFFLSKFVTNVPQMGIATFPTTECDVRNVEILKCLKLTTNTVEPLSFSIPRTRMEFFQDDIYPPTRANEPTLSASEWFGGVTKDPKLVSLKPKDMGNLSQAPIQKRGSKYNFKEEMEKGKKDESLSKEFVMNKFYAQITNNWKEEEAETAKAEEPVNDLVDDDEWDD